MGKNDNIEGKTLMHRIREDAEEIEEVKRKMQLEPFTLEECFFILDRSTCYDTKLMLLDPSIDEFEFHYDVGLFIRK